MNFEQTVSSLLNIDGTVAAAIVDYESGMMFAGSTSLLDFDLETCAAGSTEVMRAKMKSVKMVGLQDSIEDILITLNKQYHLMRPLKAFDGLFFYTILEHSKSNLALARRALIDAERDLDPA